MRQVSMKFRTWGGKRKGAGRPAQGPRPSEKHKKRERFGSGRPVHVVLRAAPKIGSLRKKDLYLAIRDASIAAAKHDDCRIIHFSIQRTHIHLICEPKNAGALARAMKSFAGSAARRINAELGREGAVFPDRYHMVVLNSPTQVRNTIAYVLGNWRHHGEDQKSFARTWVVDPFSSAISFAGWKQLEGADVMWRPSARTYESLWVWQPKTWLLREGWRRHGLIDAMSVPGGGPE
jgi:REP element-mobilizing transposase RayT